MHSLQALMAGLAFAGPTAVFLVLFGGS